jgi:NAD(P)-dependent dehydrogenase (short-subunit alcohol dehydrogenase family)
MVEVVVVTGGSAGIGLAAAHAFAAHGDSVGLIARGTARLAQARAGLEALGARVHAVAADVADADAVEAAAREIEAALGPITVWVNNAMATIYAPVRVADEAEIRRVTEVTYLGAVNGTKAALRRMAGGGTIVQVSSVLAWRGAPIQAAYCGAKFALRGFTEALRSELIHDGLDVHLTMVHLPAVNTPQFDWARNRTGQRAKAPDPVYTPETAAKAIVFAATHRRRDVWVGRQTPPTILAARLAPGVLDRVLAKKGYEGQLDGRRQATTAGNLFEPAAGPAVAQGRFEARARDGSREIFSSRQADAVAVGVLLSGAVGLAALAMAPLLPLALLRRRRC